MGPNRRKTGGTSRVSKEYWSVTVGPSKISGKSQVLNEWVSYFTVDTLTVPTVYKRFTVDAEYSL